MRIIWPEKNRKNYVTQLWYLSAKRSTTKIQIKLNSGITIYSACVGFASFSVQQTQIGKPALTLMTQISARLIGLRRKLNTTATWLRLNRESTKCSNRRRLFRAGWLSSARCSTAKNRTTNASRSGLPNARGGSDFGWAQIQTSVTS